MSSEDIERVVSNTSTNSNTSTRSNRSRRGNNKSRNRRRDVKKDNNTVKQGNKPKRNRIVSPQRTKEIEQCQHLLSHKQFKLYRETGNVSSYGFTPTHRSQTKYIINIPYDYPKQPLKVDIDLNATSQKDQLKYNNLIRNFNNKCKNDTKQNVKIPIISQLNYLLNSKDMLMDNSTQEYNNVTTLQSTFLNQFV